MINDYSHFTLIDPCRCDLVQILATAPNEVSVYLHVPSEMMH